MTEPVHRSVAGAEQSDMNVCGGCGARVLQGQVSCEWCGVAIDERLLTAPLLADELFWVQLSAEFACQSCGELSPLDRIDAGGAFHCVRCGAEQEANPVVWEEGLAFAHAVAEIGGPNARSRRPRVDLSIGESFDLSALDGERTVMTLHIGEQHRFHVAGNPEELEFRTLQVRASPGHPLCKTCKKLLKTRPGASGQVIVSCPHCQSTETYSVASEERALHAGLVSALAEAYRVGSLGAARATKPEAWWLLFRGLAPERKLLADAARARAREADEDEKQQAATHAEETALRDEVAAIEQEAKRSLTVWLGGALLLAAAAIVLGLLLR